MRRHACKHTMLESTSASSTSRNKRTLRQSRLNRVLPKVSCRPSGQSQPVCAHSPACKAAQLAHLSPGLHPTRPRLHITRAGINPNGFGSHPNRGGLHPSRASSHAWHGLHHNRAGLHTNGVGLHTHTSFPGSSSRRQQHPIGSKTAAVPDQQSGSQQPGLAALNPHESAADSSQVSATVSTAVTDHGSGSPGTEVNDASSSGNTQEETEPLLLDTRLSDSLTQNTTSSSAAVLAFEAAGQPGQVVSDNTNNGTSPSSSAAEEAKTLISLAGPISLQNVFGVSLSMIVTAFLGQIGAEELSAAVLANSVYNVTGLSLVLGMCAGMESLCGQAFGAQNYKFMGLVLQRAVLICWCLTLPLLILFQNSSALLGLLKQDPIVATGAAKYLQMIGPCLLLHGASECMRKYLLTQQIVRPSMVVSGIVTALAPLYCWIFVNKCGWGLEGGALAYFCCHLSACLGMLGYLCYYHHQLKGKATQTWPGLTWSCFRDWPQYLSFGIPATIMICMEWWAFEVLILMAGRLPNAVEAVAVMGVCFSISSFLYMLPLGLSSGLNARISMFLGAGQGANARQTLFTGIGIALLLTGLMALLVSLNGPRVFGIFTSDPGVLSLAVLCLPIVAFLCLCDGVNAVFGGALRGAGRPTLGAIVNIVCYWGIGVPLAWYLGFQSGWGAQGFWSGVTAAALVQIVWVALAIARWDWQKMGQDARAALKLAH